MHRSDDFTPHQLNDGGPDNRVDVGELILERGHSTVDRGFAHDGLPPRVAAYGAPRRGDPVFRRPRRGGLASFAHSLLALLLCVVLAGLLVVPLGWQDQA